jgi:hypothetical protein
MDAELGALCGHLVELEEALSAVVVTVAEDRPDGSAPRIVDELHERLGDVLGATGQAAAQAGSLVDLATEDAPPLGRIRKALRDCHAHHLEASTVLRDHLLDPWYQSQLARLANDKAGEWQPWAAAVRAGLIACRSPLVAVDQDLVTCWAALTDRNGQISVTAHAVGQHFAGTAIPATAPSPVEAKGR